MAGEIQLHSTTFATESGGTVTVSNVDSATNRQNLGLEIGVDVQQFDADTTKNDVANTFTANQIISVTDNTNAALRVTQLGTGNALVVEDSTNPDSTPFVVDASGNVGIGLSGPGVELEVAGDIRANGIYGQADTNTSIQFPGSDVITFNEGGSEVMRIDSSGNLLVGVTSTDGSQLYVKQTTEDWVLGIDATSGTQYFQAFRYNGVAIGSITGNTTSTSYLTASDYRLKDNITEITDGITRVKQLNPSRFNFIADPENTVDGFIAHEVQDIVPEAVTGEKDAVNEDGSIRPQGIDQSKLVPLLTAALQEAITLIESQQSQIDALTARIEALENT
jgi:hypothetical protein